MLTSHSQKPSHLSFFNDIQTEGPEYNTEGSFLHENELTWHVGGATQTTRLVKSSVTSTLMPVLSNFVYRLEGFYSKNCSHQ